MDMMESVRISHLFAKALYYIQHVGSKGVFSIYNLLKDDPVAQSGWFETFTDGNGCIDVESDFRDVLIAAKSIDELPPKLKAFVLTLEQAYK